MKAIVTYKEDGSVECITLTKRLGLKLDSNGIPKDYKSYLGFSKMDWESVIYPLGFREVVSTDFDSQTEKLTNELEEFTDTDGFKKVRKKKIDLTQEEIEANDEAQAEADRLQQRAELLQAGATVISNNKNYSFSEAELQRFMVMKNEVASLGGQSIEYPDTDGNWNVISIAEATNIAVIGMGIFVNIYKTTG